MPLVLRGKLKDRVEIYWSGTFESIMLCPEKKTDTILYFFKVQQHDRLNLYLGDLNFSQVKETELNITAVAGEEVSIPLKIQKCPHSDCNLWGHAKEDGYCKHCGRKIRQHQYTSGFPKLETTSNSIKLWDGKQGILSKSKEEYEHYNQVYSVGQFQYDGEETSKKKVDILEEKFSETTLSKFTHLHKILENSDLIENYWKPPLACFQKDFNRILWIYYNKEENDCPSISAYNYIISKVNEPLSTKEIICIGIQLCHIAKTIHSYNQYWCSLKLVDLILQRKNNGKFPISIFLQSKDIAWQENNLQKLLDNTLIPWELYWDNPASNSSMSESAEVYVIAATLYLLKAKAPNLLHYNPISFPHSLPGLKLFKPEHNISEPTKNVTEQYFESILNQALISHPQERGYQKLEDFSAALESLLYPKENSDKTTFNLEVGSDLDVGDEKQINDFTINQDALFVTKHNLTKKGWGIFALCDGISTANVGSGADASRIVVEVFKDWWEKHSEEEHEKTCRNVKENMQEACNFLNSLVNLANKKIYEQVSPSINDSRENLVMGTTITTGIIFENILLFGWVGDSPIFRFSQYGWEKLNFEDNERNAKLLAGMSLDDVFTENGNAITRCVGANFYKENLNLHFDYTYLNSGENILVCSDGISDYIEPEADFALQENYRMMRLASILATYDNDPLINAKALASILISSTNRIGGGKDNLSAIVLRTIPKNVNSVTESYNRLRLMSFIRQKKLQRANADETAKITRRLSITQDID